MTGPRAARVGGFVADISKNGPGDRRGYHRGWWKRDRRRVIPALLGGLTALVPSGAAPAEGPVVPELTGGHEPPEREAGRGSNVLADARLHVAPNETAERQIREWRSTRPEDARLLENIVSQPAATWFGDWNGDVRAAVDRLVGEASAGGEVPVLVAYNIPNRDCDQHSAGGVGSAEEYRGWMRALAQGIGKRKAVVILEPDAVALVSCLTPQGQKERFSLLQEAVTLLKSETGAIVYVDAGHAQWVDEAEIAHRLNLAGVAHADGFALNVSNFIPTDVNTAYGERVSRRLNGAHFVIDSSRNGGAVAQGEWCNPAGAALGSAPTTRTSHPVLDALLWVKRPGESDGLCNNGPEAGLWWGDYALQLVRNRSAQALIS